MKKQEIIKRIREIIDDSQSTKEAFEKLVDLDNKIFEKVKPQRSELPPVCRCKFPKNYNNVCGLCGKLIK
jgi:hypothetical protein